jgi:hypothetical protein
MTTTRNMPRSRFSLHDVGRQVDQIGPVVIGNDLDVLGQELLVQFLRLRLDALEHVLGLFAGAQQDDAFDRVVLLLVAELAQPRRDADDHAADILEQHRRAVVHGQDDIADVFRRHHAADAAHVIELAALRIEAAAGIAVVGGERGFDLRHRQAGARDFRRIEQHLILHRAAAEAGIVGHAGHGFVLRLDGPGLEVLSSIGERSGLCST